MIAGSMLASTRAADLRRLRSGGEPEWGCRTNARFLCAT